MQNAISFLFPFSFSFFNTGSPGDVLQKAAVARKTRGFRMFLHRTPSLFHLSNSRLLDFSYDYVPLCKWQYSFIAEYTKLVKGGVKDIAKLLSHPATHLNIAIKKCDLFCVAVRHRTLQKRFIVTGFFLSVLLANLILAFENRRLRTVPFGYFDHYAR